MLSVASTCFSTKGCFYSPCSLFPLLLHAGSELYLCQIPLGKACFLFCTTYMPPSLFNMSARSKCIGLCSCLADTAEALCSDSTFRTGPVFMGSISLAIGWQMHYSTSSGQSPVVQDVHSSAVGLRKSNRWPCMI